MIANPPLRLAVYVYDTLGLTLALPDGHWIPGRDWMQEGPAFRRLTADANSLHDPNHLHAWLEAFLPENGARTPYRAHAALELDRHGYTGARDNPAALLWGNVNVEYAGAVTFMQARDDPPAALPAAASPAYHPLTDAEIADRLREATLIARNTLPGRPHTWPERRASLSGMRGKLCLTATADGRWTAAHGSSLNTWVVKDEHDPDLPGEAGIESICQRSLALLGIPAATTRARVFAGRQAVLSERTDRRVGPDGIVRARHQEEWCQILGFDPSRKYDDGTRDEPRWPSAYQVLTAHAVDPAHEHARLTRAVAATWLLAHCDLHRRNLGFLHAPANEPTAIELAPLYDVANPLGTGYSHRLAITIAGQSQLHTLTPKHWIRHSDQCGIDPDTTLSTLRQLVRDLPDAIATAREYARADDENVLQAHVDRRGEATLEHVRRRGKAFLQLDAALTRHRPPVAT